MNSRSTSTEDLQSRLEASHTFQSLKQEQQLCLYLRALGWHANHSYYYADPETGKPREIDVEARQAWVRSKKAPIFWEGAGISLITEVKSAKGFHIVFAPAQPDSISPGGVRLKESWLGDIDKHADAISERLAAAGLDLQQRKQTLLRFEETAYPKETHRLKDFCILPPPSPYVATAFRETNIAAEKELDSSVFWKAFRTLESAVKATNRRILDVRLSGVVGRIKYAQSEDEDIVAGATNEFEHETDNIVYFHSLLVMDCDLWMLDNGNAQQIPWCRFVQVGVLDYHDWWIDVVNSAHIEQFLKELNDYYTSQFQKANAKPFFAAT